MLSNERDVTVMFYRKYPHINMIDCETILLRAITAFLDLTFPFQREISCIPKSMPRAWGWVYDCMLEIAEREGVTSMTSYSENGLSMTWDNSQISNGLRSRIVPMVGALR